MLCAKFDFLKCRRSNMKTICMSASFSICLIFLAAYAQSRAEDISNVRGDIVRGNIVCIEIDGEGKAEVSEDFTQCTGLVYVLGVDGKIYSLHGSEEEMQKISAGSKTRMGYRLPLRLKGKDAGHRRAWRLYTPGLDGDKEDTAEITVTGTILCLFPNYRDGNVSPVVATEPCNEYEDHAHVIYTNEGQTYAVHGPHEKIAAIEKSSKRENVTLTGKLQGNQGGWILYIN